MQSKLWSFLEAFTNTVIGFIIAVLAQMFFFRILGIIASIEQSILLTIGMALLSLIRGYLIRRVFNKLSLTTFKQYFQRC